MRLVACALLLAACGAHTVRPRSVSLTAPATARWASASVYSNYNSEHVQGTLFPHDYESATVRLVVRLPSGEAHEIAIEGTFGEGPDARELAEGDYKLEASPDGSWLAVSLDRGANWTLVEPETLMLCRHLGWHGRPDWSHAPPPLALALDLLAPGTPGGLRLVHASSQSRVSLEAPAVERTQAAKWALAHATEPDVRPAVVAALFATEDNITDDTIADAVRKVLASTPTMHDDLLHAFDTPRDGHLRIATTVAELLWTDAGVQAALAKWIAKAVGPNGPRIFEYGATPNSDWQFAAAVWDLARLVQRDGLVTPEAEQAAIAVIAYTSRLLPSAAERAAAAKLGNLGKPWSELTSVAAQDATIYALHVLIAAHTPKARAAVEAADFDRKGPPHAPPAAYNDPIKDTRDGEFGLVDADAWFRLALVKLADAR